MRFHPFALCIVLLGCGGASGESKSAAAAGVDEPDRKVVIDEMASLRDDKGRHAADVVDDTGTLAETAKAIEGGTKPDDAIHAAVGRLEASGTKGVEGACASNDNLGELDMPKFVSENDLLKVSIVVIHNKQSPAYTVCFLSFPTSGDDSSSDN